MNPTATYHLASGEKIVVELLPLYAPNTVNSFIYCAKNGWLNNHKIQRIVPGKWIDLSYSAFHHKECKYLIPNEFALHPEIKPLDSLPGCMCMGGYGDHGLAGCEPFFPLTSQPSHKGVYPVFGKVTEGMRRLRRLEKVATRPVRLPNLEIEINEPIDPEIITKVTLDLHGVEYPEPIKVDTDWIPPTWK
jgi:peptidyl-prolyl cis-trans isomerase B (cyclophilin B)